MKLKYKRMLEEKCKFNNPLIVHFTTYKIVNIDIARLIVNGTCYDGINEIEYIIKENPEIKKTYAYKKYQLYFACFQNSVSDLIKR